MGCLIDLIRRTERVVEQTVARHQKEDPGGRIDARGGAGKTSFDSQGFILLQESLFLHEHIERCDNLASIRLIGLTDILHLGKNR